MGWENTKPIRLSKEKNQVTHLNPHFLISVLNLLLFLQTNIHGLRQNCTVPFLEISVPDIITCPHKSYFHYHNYGPTMWPLL